MSSLLWFDGITWERVVIVVIRVAIVVLCGALVKLSIDIWRLPSDHQNQLRRYQLGRWEGNNGQ